MMIKRRLNLRAGQGDVGVSIGIFFLLLLGLLLLSGCSPHRVSLDRAPLVEAETFSSELELIAGINQARAWWLDFPDPFLHSLMDLSQEQNLSLKQAASRLAQAEALYRQARGVRYPSVDIIGASGVLRDRDGDRESRHSIGAGLTIGIDIFGRLRAEELARSFRQLAGRYALEAARLALTQEIAEAYFGALEQKSQLALLKEQIAIDQELLELIEKSFQAGVVSRLDLLQQRSQLAETQSLLPVTELQERLYENRLDVLLGEAPDGTNRISEGLELGEIPTLPASGVPLDLLLRRPDLQAMKAELIARDAEVARAIADRLPSIVLNGSSVFVGGSDSSRLVSQVFIDLFGPLLDWGVRRAEVDRRKAFLKEQLFAFSEAYLFAIEEVENGFYRVKKQTEFINELETRKQVLAETLEEARTRYGSGLTDYLPVLDALQELRRTERRIVAEKRVLMNYAVLLSVSLGGGLLEQPKL